MKYIFYVLYAPIYILGGLIFWIGFTLCVLADIVARDNPKLRTCSDYPWTVGRYIQALAFAMMLSFRLSAKMLKTAKDRIII